MTRSIYCVTVNHIANVLKTEKQIAVISALAEGSSIRSIERMTGINRNTIMNLGVVDYGMIVKNYSHPTVGHHHERRYSPADLVFVKKDRISGRPKMNLVSTSYVERMNGITRQHMKRLSRLTYAFSKKLENFEAAIALHLAYYNFVRMHGTLKNDLRNDGRG
jgi:hypothetical protein